MCEKEPKRRSCTECPQYDGMKCSATDFTLGDRDEVLYQEHRRGFICLDTGEAELKGDAAIQWTAEQERLSLEKGYKSCEEMWAAEGKQVKAGFRIDKDNEHLEPLAQISNGPGPVKLTFQYEEKAKATDWPQYKGLECRATDAWTSDNGTLLQAANAKSVDDTMYHPNQPENQQWYTVEARANIGVDLDLLREHNPNIKVIRASELEAGSPSEEVHPVGMDTPRKGKIVENNHLHNTLRCALIRNPEAHCGNCKKSHTEGDRLVCDKWGLRDILMPYRPCEKWAFDPLKVRAEERQIHYAEGSGLQYAENPPPLFKDLNGFWEPVRPRSCTNCKSYNDPICMKMATHIGTRQEILAKEEENGFLCFAADQTQLAE